MYICVKQADSSCFFFKRRGGNSLLHSAGLAHQKGPAEVAARRLRNLPGQLGRQVQTLFFTDGRQNTTDLPEGEAQSRRHQRSRTEVFTPLPSCQRCYSDASCPACLFCAGQGNSDSQTSALDGPDDLGGGGGAQDEAAGGHVLFHRPSQSMLGVFSQSVHLRQHNH